MNIIRDALLSNLSQSSGFLRFIAQLKISSVVKEKVYYNIYLHNPMTLMEPADNFSSDMRMRN